MFMKPMLLSEQAAPDDDDAYLYEPLIDGHRLQLSMNAGKVSLYTRFGYDVTRQYPELQHVPLKKSADIVIDGEVACFDAATGRADFGRLQERFRMKRVPAIRAAKREMPVVYFVFDILSWNGTDLRGLKLTTRKRLLYDVLEGNDYFQIVRFADRDGRSLLRQAAQMGLGGIVGKRKDSFYESGKRGGWLKIAHEEPGAVPKAD